jgi:hypothetical protein
VKLKAVAQREPPGLTVGLGGEPVHHLWLRLERAVLSKQRIEDHEAVVARDVGAGNDGIEEGDVDLRDEFQCLGGLRPGDMRYRKRGGARCEQGAAFHHLGLGSLLIEAQQKLGHPKTVPRAALNEESGRLVRSWLCCSFRSAPIPAAGDAIRYVPIADTARSESDC